jgi:hypothetical protein
MAIEAASIGNEAFASIASGQCLNASVGERHGAILSKLLGNEIAQLTSDARGHTRTMDIEHITTCEHQRTTTDGYSICVRDIVVTPTKTTF